MVLAALVIIQISATAPSTPKPTPIASFALLLFGFGSVGGWFELLKFIDTLKPTPVFQLTSG
jgi:hypothetical protein